ncbi:MAG TPA: hypothetical protein VD905_14325 [Flavobacteriales bacterium]|nr:hypothetical protein [Flavobacteriales bacterium]
MKAIIFSVVLIVSLNVHAQMWERGKKNFFLEPEASLNFANYKKSAYMGNKYGMSFGLSGGKIFKGFLKTGLVYRYNQNTIGNWYSTALTHTPVQRQYAGIKAELMVPFLQLNLGKSNRYECKTLSIYLMLGPEFGYNFAGGTSDFKINSTELLLCASWGFLLKNSGSNKKQAANDIYFCLNMKHGQTPFAQRAADSQKFYSTYWGVSILWVKYKTGNWLR